MQNRCLVFALENQIQLILQDRPSFLHFLLSVGLTHNSVKSIVQRQILMHSDVNEKELRNVLDEITHHADQCPVVLFLHLRAKSASARASAVTGVRFGTDDRCCARRTAVARDGHDSARNTKTPSCPSPATPGSEDPPLLSRLCFPTIKMRLSRIMRRYPKRLTRKLPERKEVSISKWMIVYS